MEFFAKKGKIFLNEQEISLKGVNWFGMEVAGNVVHGLWAKPLNSLIKILKDNKINAVRLTMSAECMLNMDSLQVSHVSASLNPGMDKLTVGQFLDILIGKFKEAGILVMPNMHRLKTAEDILPLWYSNEYPENIVIKAWQNIAKRYKNEPHVFAMDLKNEPHDQAAWGNNDVKTDWQKACERIGKAIHEVNPKVLIFVAGITSQIWGDCVDHARLKPVKLSIPQKVVYTPHLYKHWNYPNTYGFDNTEYFNNVFGNLIKQGKETVIIGEWGYSHRDDDDIRWANEFVTYLTNLKMHSGFYWCFNQNGSGLHGFLGDDWNSVISSKMNLLSRLTPNPTLFDFKTSNAQTPTVIVPGPTPPSITPPKPTDKAKVELVIKTSSSWKDGTGSTFYKIDVYVKNRSTQVLKDVKLVLTGGTVTDSWSATRQNQVFSFPDWLLSNKGLSPNSEWNWGYVSKNSTGTITIQKEIV